MTVFKLCVCSFMHFLCVKSTYQLSPLLRRPGLSQGIHVSTDRDLTPDPRLGLLSEATSRMHHQHAIRREPIHVAVGIFPLCCLFLESIPQKRCCSTQKGSRISPKYWVRAEGRKVSNFHSLFKANNQMDKI